MRMTRHAVVFELYNLSALPRLSEALDSNSQLISKERTIYAGRAIVLLRWMRGKAGCLRSHTQRVGLDRSGSWACWKNNHGQIAEQFKAFIGEWQKTYLVLPEFKVVAADMQTFFMTCDYSWSRSNWGIQSAVPPTWSQKLETNLVKSLAPKLRVVQAIDALIDRFEFIVPEFQRKVTRFFRLTCDGSYIPICWPPPLPTRPLTSPGICRRLPDGGHDASSARRRR